MILSLRKRFDDYETMGEVFSDINKDNSKMIQNISY